MLKLFSLFLIGLAHDEVHDIRVVDPQDPHIGTPACSALLDGFRSDIKDPHERDRTAGNACGGHDDVIGRAQSGKENPVPPPDLWIRAVNLTASNISSMESPTGRTKQAESCPRFTSGVHEGWRVGKKFKPGHALVEGFQTALWCLPFH